jgi:hypothetical protein
LPATPFCALSIIADRLPAIRTQRLGGTRYALFACIAWQAQLGKGGHRLFWWCCYGTASNRAAPLRPRGDLLVDAKLGIGWCIRKSRSRFGTGFSAPEVLVDAAALSIGGAQMANP